MADLGMLINIRADGSIKASNDIDKVSGSADTLEKKAKVAGKATDDLTGRVERAGKEASKTSSSFGLLGKAIGGFVSVMAVKNTLAIADSYGQMSARIRLAINDMSEYDYVQNRLLKTANATQRSLEETQDIFIDTSGNLRDMGYSLKASMDITDSFSYALVRNATSAERATNALAAYDYALNKKTVDVQTWKSISSALPSLEVSMAELFNVPLAQIQKLGFEGKITVEELNEAFTKSLNDNKKAAESMGMSMGGASEYFSNKLSVVIGTADKAVGITALLSSGVVFLADNIENLLIPAIGIGAVYAVRALTTAFAGLGAAGGIITVTVMALGVLANAWLVNSRRIEKMRGDLQSLGEELDDFTVAMLEDRELNLRAVMNSDYSDLDKANNKITEHERQIERIVESREKMSTAQRVYNGLTEESLARTRNALTQEIANRDRIEKKLERSADLMKESSIAIGKIKDGTVELERVMKGGIVEANSDVLTIYDSIAKQLYSINNSGLEAQLLYKKQAGELKNIDDHWFGILRNFAQYVDSSIAANANQKELAEILKSVEEQYNNINLTTAQITLNKAAALGATKQELDLLNEQLTAISNAPKAKSGSSKTSLNYFDDALKSIGDELIAIKVMNQDLVIFGDPNQYNAVKDMTAQLNDQKGVLAGITASQREILLLKAQELDSQKQINAILNLQNDYKHRFEDLAFELDLIGLTKKEVEKLTFFRDLDNEAKLISIGMSKENAEALQAEIEKIKELYGAYQAVKEERENDPIQGMRDGLNGFMDEAGSARSVFEDATKGALDSMASGLADFVATGKMDFKSLTQSILQDISKILAQWAIAQAMGAAFRMLPGFSGGGSVGAPVRNTGMGSFDSGGYTGFGGKYEPAGIVHRDEYVMDQDTTRALGVPFLDSLRRSAKSGKGYANGGYVGASVPMSISGQAGSQRSDIVVNQTLHIESGANIDEQMIKKLQYEMRKEAMKISENISLRTIGDQKRSGGMLRG